MDLVFDDYLKLKRAEKKKEHLWVITFNFEQKEGLVWRLKGLNPEKEDIKFEPIYTFLLFQPFRDFVIVHNHPNDTLIFSSQDKKFLKRAKKVFKRVNYNLLGLVVFNSKGRFKLVS